MATENQSIDAPPSPARSETAADANEHGPELSDPFGEILVVWNYKRFHLANVHHRVQVSGYENLIGDIRKLLEFFGPAAVTEVKKSVLGSFMYLPDFNTRSGKALHYMVSRQVKPEEIPGRDPIVDSTALWFKVENKIFRFSRVEYALVSGLNFGPSSFDPYSNNLVVPEDSVHSRLFDNNDKVNPVDLHTKFKDKEYGRADDAVKMAKLLLATHYVLGYEQARIKIPLWLWALVEDKKAWEQFPWGSLSFQILMEGVDKVTCADRPRASGRGYHLKGNTIAFLAWIHCALNAVGETIGGKLPMRKRPRFLRYSYTKNNDFPDTLEATELHPQLIPYKKELDKGYWKSLEKDPESMPFAFEYDPNDSKKKKKPRDDDNAAAVHATNDAPSNVVAATASTSTAPVSFATLLYGPDRDALIKEIGDYAGEIAAKRSRIEAETHFHIQNKQLVKEVGEYVFAKLLEANVVGQDHFGRVQQPNTELAGGETTPMAMDTAGANFEITDKGMATDVPATAAPATDMPAADALMAEAQTD